jgi:DNA-binding response OmpR family regulator
MGERIFIVEDDKALSDQIASVLRSYSYEAFEVQDFLHVEEEFHQLKPDLVLMDINLPHYDGNFYCRMFRKTSAVPIVMISARTSDMDQIYSMELGADEYIVKPFSIPVLLAKINAILRRSSGNLVEGTNQQVISLKSLSLDENSFKVKNATGQLELSKTEYKLLRCFLLKPDCVITREDLLEEIWDLNTFVDDNTLTVNVTRIKHKLSELGYQDLIKTKRGLGYIFDTSVMSQ